MCSAEEAYGAGDNPLAGMDSFGMDAQEAERQRAIWEAELATLDEEISTLRAVLASKVSKLIQNFEIGKLKTKIELRKNNFRLSQNCITNSYFVSRFKIALNLNAN